MVIPNMVMKFHNFDIFLQICQIFDLSSALACHMLSVPAAHVMSFPYSNIWTETSDKNVSAPVWIEWELT